LNVSRESETGLFTVQQILSASYEGSLQLDRSEKVKLCLAI